MTQFRPQNESVAVNMRYLTVIFRSKLPLTLADVIGLFFPSSKADHCMEPVDQGTFDPTSSDGNRKSILYVLLLSLELQQSSCQREHMGNLGSSFPWTLLRNLQEDFAWTRSCAHL